jgi:hypothetical protein
MSIFETVVGWNAATLKISHADRQAVFDEIAYSLAQHFPNCESISSSGILERLDEIYARELASHK